jgi:hypothetical protein
VELVHVVSAGSAEPLRAVALGEGRFRLAQSSMMVPLACGDEVTCVPSPDRDGRLEVVDVHPADAVLTVFQAAEGADVDTLVRLWQATGAGPTERGGTVLVTVWPDVPMDAVAQQLNGDEDRGTGTWILAAERHERMRAAQSEIDFGRS